jgi:murein DD-endopeptidase MepM/ murein hydrolase activator NlpD
MTQRRWTVMIVPHGSDSPRSFPVSERGVRVAMWVAGVLGLAFLTFGGYVVTQLGTPAAIAAHSENQALTGELAYLQSKVKELQDTIESIGKRDEQIRLFAGLPSVDSEVREAGIGGPGSPDLSHDPLYQTNRSLGRQAFGARVDLDGLLRRANVLLASFAEISDTLSRHADKLASTPSIMPTAGWLTSNFSRSRLHPILHIARPHEGIDVTAPMGAPIVAPASGVVIDVGRESGYGLIVEIDHGNGIVTKYAHCSRVLVKKGKRVTRGEVIAAVGNSGISTGPHLHYEIHVNGRVVDPLTYVLPGAIVD